MSPHTGAATLEPVDQEAVVRHWLRSECEAAAVGRTAGPVVETGADGTLPAPERVGTLSDREALDALLRAKPSAAGFLADEESVAWYRTTVGPDRFGALRLIESPAGLLWRALAPDRSPVTAARRLVDADPDASTLDGVDVGRIRAIRESLVAGRGPVPSLVVRTRRGQAPWTIVDGNHRAVALAMDLLDAEGGWSTDAVPVGESAAGFVPQPVYLGVRPNPVLRPARERLGGLARRLLGREPRPP